MLAHVLKNKPHSHRLMPLILATQETEVRRIVVHSQLGQIVRETLYQKTFHKNRASGMAQGSEFKPQY
jgi:hypothetical protein